tara:strand:- start:4683 stop:5465 length:783 start_codon:yes stop_codon:yes gene_type:complete
MQSLLIIIAGADELRPVVKELRATTVNGSRGPFEGTLSNSAKVIVVSTSVGSERAYHVTIDAIQRFRPEYVLSAGTCGALVQGLNISDWVVTGDVRAIGLAREQWPTLKSVQSIDATSANRLRHALKQTPKWHEGRLVTIADGPVHCPIEKSKIAKHHEAIAVDMESYGIAQAAIEQGLPWVVARVIVDTPALPLPELGVMNAHTGRPPLSGIAKYVLMNPLVGPPRLYGLRALVQRYAFHLVRMLPEFTTCPKASAELS